eukprot:UN21411
MAERLFGVEMVEVEFYPGEAWVDERTVQTGLVRKYALLENNKIKGTVYFDIFQRPGKQPLAHAAPVRLRRTKHLAPSLNKIPNLPAGVIYRDDYIPNNIQNAVACVP